MQYSFILLEKVVNQNRIQIWFCCFCFSTGRKRDHLKPAPEGEGGPQALKHFMQIVRAPCWEPTLRQVVALFFINWEKEKVWRGL
jgi:hypothetical protein